MVRASPSHRVGLLVGEFDGRPLSTETRVEPFANPVSVVIGYVIMAQSRPVGTGWPSMKALAFACAALLSLPAHAAALDLHARDVGRNRKHAHMQVADLTGRRVLASKRSLSNLRNVSR